MGLQNTAGDNRKIKSVGSSPPKKQKSIYLVPEKANNAQQVWNELWEASSFTLKTKVPKVPFPQAFLTP